MDVREKLVEWLADLDCNAEYCKDCEFADDIDGCVRRQKEIIADRFIAHGVTVREWISVEDRLPDAGGYYLVCQKDKSWFDEVIQTARWSKVTQSFRGAQAGCFMGFVTHWMPLPQPPEGE